jgi:hypothetical protein
MSLCDSIGSTAAPLTGRRFRVHTQSSAFHADEEDDESVRMSKITNHRARAVTPAIPAARSRLKRAPKTNFYSVQMNSFSPTPNFQLPENKALPFFYAIQMKSHHSLLTDHQSPRTKTRSTP